MSAGGTVAVVGAGNMGGAMARRLLGLGWTVRVRDIDAPTAQALGQAGAVPCGSPAETAHGAQALVVAVVDAAQLREVLFGASGAAAALPAGAPVLLCPTIGPGDCEAVAARLAAAGLHPVDAPMSGGPQRALDGSMSLMVACTEAAWDRSAPLLQALSGRIVRVGARWGDGARTKLVNNLLAGINLVGAAEALALARRLGLDGARTLEVIGQSSGQSWIGGDRLPRALAGDLVPRAHLSLLRKDTALAIEAAEAAGFRGPLGAAARDVFAQAADAGLAGLDDAVLLRWIEQGG